MNKKHQTQFWNQQLEHFQDAVKWLSNEFQEDISIGGMYSDGIYCNIDVSCARKDLLNMLEMKMINFQFSNTKSYSEVLIRVIDKFSKGDQP